MLMKIYLLNLFSTIFNYYFFESIDTHSDTQNDCVNKLQKIYIQVKFLIFVCISPKIEKFDLKNIFVLNLQLYYVE